MNQGSGFYPMDLCDFSGIAEVLRDKSLALAYTLYDLDVFKIYIIDDTANKLVMFNMHLRQKGFIDTKQYVLNIPSAYLMVADTDNPARWHIHISSQLKADKFVNYYLRIFHKIKQIAQKIGQGANWVGQRIYKPLKPYIDTLAPPIVSKGLQVASSGLDLIYGNNGQDGVTNMINFRNDIGNFIDEPRVRYSIQKNRFIRLHPNISRNIDRAMGSHLGVQEVGEEDF
ncbi:MAG: hypothetical protein EZS28_003038 [Streblomastix strix]|uniref:Uncharacterized protein n=1 Tax=Streblomastix strix TaxID=222440 RepID=A0A5J4X2M5_9EUKA|nr:MAG: hypothetical protein EZS28_003038 [Streblomastix strix]